MDILNEQQLNFLNWYKALIKNDNLPSRSDIRPQDLKPFLGEVSLMKIAGPDQAIMQLGGSITEQLLHTKITGLNYFDSNGYDVNSIENNLWMLSLAKVNSFVIISDAVNFGPQRLPVMSSKHNVICNSWVEVRSHET